MTAKKNLQRCPINIIKATPAVRIKHFKEYLSDHSHLHQARNEAMNAINRSTGPRVILVTGPTGVGKTTLAKAIGKEVMKQYWEEANRDRGFLPVVNVNAVPPTGPSFNWKDFNVRCLLGHGDVLTDRKLLLPRQGRIFDDLPVYHPIENSAADKLRRVLEACIKERRTKVLIVDEGHHILMVKDPSRLEYQFEALKSLTIESDVTIVLVGTYRLLDIRDQSGQLVRRSEIIHLPRYDVRDAGDAAAFASFGTALAHQLPFEEVPDFSHDWEYFYIKTAGCVGILKDWFARCLEDAIANGRTTFTADDADKLSLTNKALRTIIEEAMAGEQKLRDDDIDDIHALLTGVPSKPAPKPKAPTGAARRVGERKPVRDAVGAL